MITATPSDIGRRVIYRGPGLDIRIGVITHFDDSKAWVRFGSYRSEPVVMALMYLEWDEYDRNNT